MAPVGIILDTMMERDKHDTLYYPLRWYGGLDTLRWRRGRSRREAKHVTMIKRDLSEGERSDTMRW